MSNVDTDPSTSSAPDAESGKFKMLSYEEIDKQYRPIFFARALKQGLSHHEAEDAVQNALINIYVNLSNYVEQGYTPRRWLHTIMRNAILDEFRKKIRRPTDSLDDVVDVVDAGHNEMEFIHPADPTTEASFSEIEFEESLKQISDMLPEDFKDTFVQFARTDDSYSQIAQDLDVPKGTVGTRIFRAREIIKKNKNALKNLGIIEISEN